MKSQFYSQSQQLIFVYTKGVQKEIGLVLLGDNQSR